MKRLVLVLLALPLILVVYLLLTQMRWKFSAPRKSPALTNGTNPAATNHVEVQVVPVAAGTPRPGQPLLGETILRDYANSNFPPQNDLTLMSRLMENSLLLLKSAGNRPLSANEDWAALWHGENSARERFLPDHHPALNPQGQLVDRWGSPLFFHALGGGRFEIRSAGPDRRLWTEDDLQRNPDGSFRRGSQTDSPNPLRANR